MISFSYLQQLAKYLMGEPLGILETIDDTEETALGVVKVDQLEDID